MKSAHLPALSGAGICDGFGDEWLKIGGIKAFADGAVAGRSCAVAEPFESFRTTTPWVFLATKANTGAARATHTATITIVVNAANRRGARARPRERRERIRQDSEAAICGD